MILLNLIPSTIILGIFILPAAVLVKYRHAICVKKRDPKPLASLAFLNILGTIILVIVPMVDPEDASGFNYCVFKEVMTEIWLFTFLMIYMMRSYCLWKFYHFHFDQFNMSKQLNRNKHNWNSIFGWRKSSNTWARAILYPTAGVSIGVASASIFTEGFTICREPNLILSYLTIVLFGIVISGFAFAIRNVKDKYLIKIELTIVAGLAIIFLPVYIVVAMKVNSHAYNIVIAQTYVVLTHCLSFCIPLYARYRNWKYWNNVISKIKIEEEQLESNNIKILNKKKKRATSSELVRNPETTKDFEKRCSEFFVLENYFFLKAFYKIMDDPEKKEQIETFRELSSAYLEPQAYYTLNVQAELRKSVMSASTVEEYKKQLGFVEQEVVQMLDENVVRSMKTE